MILVRSPLRITLGGGGTDLPSYADTHGGFTLTAAIQQYVYVSVLRPFRPGFYLKYSAQETVETVEQIQHPIFREAFRLFDTPAQVEVTTVADIPSGTGLGSSSSFTTALVQALSLYQGRGRLTPACMASLASTVEIDRCGAPIGRQDQYAAAYGGVQAMTHTAGGVATVAVPVTDELEDGLLLFYTGGTRPAGAILEDQERRTRGGEAVMLANLHATKQIGLDSYEALLARDYVAFGQLLHAHWQCKSHRAGVSNPQVEAGYQAARAAGALGGKLVGAGGCGFLLVYAQNQAPVRQAMTTIGWPEVRCRFDQQGTQVVAL